MGDVDWAAEWGAIEDTYCAPLPVCLALIGQAAKHLEREIDADLYELDRLLGRLDTNRARLERLCDLAIEAARVRSRESNNWTTNQIRIASDLP
jgi:hypothetical protein